MTRQRISREKVKQAIPKSGGLISRIATKAGYSWTATRDFIAADEELKLLVKDEEEAVDDMAESAIIKKISEGDEQSAKWWLARRRRVKFGDSLAIGNPDGTALMPAKDKEADARHDRALSSLADAIRESVYGAGTKQTGEVGAAE